MTGGVLYNVHITYIICHIYYILYTHILYVHTYTSIYVCVYTYVHIHTHTHILGIIHFLSKRDPQKSDQLYISAVSEAPIPEYGGAPNLCEDLY